MRDVCKEISLVSPLWRGGTSICAVVAPSIGETRGEEAIAE